MSGNQAFGQTYKTETFCISGPATAAGNLVFKIVNRPGDCTDTAIFSHTQNYDATGGGNPTTSTEIRDAAELGLSATVPAGFTVDPLDSGVFKCITIASTTQFFDVCVDGEMLVPGVNDSYSENGVSVSLEAPGGKTKIPTVSEWGLAVMAILMLTAGTVVVMRRRAAVA